MFSAVLDDAMREQREGETDDDLLFTRPYDDGYRTYMVSGESPSRKNGGGCGSRNAVPVPRSSQSTTYVTLRPAS